RPPGTGTILPIAIEYELVRWVNALGDEGVPVTTTMLKIQVLEVSKVAKISNFSASWCWQKHFKRRHQFSLRAKPR
ncbi:hypothetical protein PHYSODRAFT_480105, partial [Phytophthora sojae]